MVAICMRAEVIFIALYPAPHHPNIYEKEKSERKLSVSYFVLFSKIELHRTHVCNYSVPCTIVRGTQRGLKF